MKKINFSRHQENNPIVLEKIRCKCGNFATSIRQTIPYCKECHPNQIIKREENEIKCQKKKQITSANLN